MCEPIYETMLVFNTNLGKYEVVSERIIDYDWDNANDCENPFNDV